MGVLNDPLEQAQAMGISFGIEVEDPLVVYSVDTYLAGGMNDPVFRHHDTDMGNAPFFVVKKSQVPLL